MVMRIVVLLAAGLALAAAKPGDRDFPRSFLLGKDTSDYDEFIYIELTREQLRASQDVFFYGRGDTLYLLFDPTDTLQALYADSIYISWCTRDYFPGEWERERERWLEQRVDFELFSGAMRQMPVDCVYWNEPLTPLKTEGTVIVDSAFVYSRKPATRVEFGAFFWREVRRRGKERERTGNWAWSYSAQSPIFGYFDVVYMLIPTSDGRFRLYKIY